MKEIFEVVRINLESVPRPAKTLQPAKKAMEQDHVENDSENKDAVPTGGNGESMQ
ncbi:GD17745 [Drosophila simulans]|uniref:GD17745 n=1 Tax=Drosophila simulans TaxID=7240 RepID=B4NSY2_DROSI|nr:GD17745 [Drosophila simulans]